MTSDFIPDSMNGQNSLYSIRMRASLERRHVSGAERIVLHDRIDETVRDLVVRARGRATEPDRIVVSVDPVDDSSVISLTSLDLTTLEIPDYRSGRRHAARVLGLTGVSEQAIGSAMEQLSRGAASSGVNMRGAMIMDASTGERLEPDRSRGIRSSRFDWTGETFETALLQLTGLGLTHHRTHEALALATKVAHASGMVAELCWSDEPDYTAGYVASLATGYVRFPFLKQKGDPLGGRAFFVDRGKTDMCALTRYLETQAVLITAVGLFSPATDPQTFFDREAACHV
jgi:6-carboxyhexanoate--CoA ligase